MTETAKVKHIVLAWAGGEHRFEILLSTSVPTITGEKVKPLDDGVPFGPLAKRVMGDEWSVADVAYVIRAGLLGGGSLLTDGPRSVMEELADAFSADPQSPVRQAEALVNEHVLGAPLGPSLVLARVILMVALVGVDPQLADEGVSVAEATNAVAVGDAPNVGA